MASLEGCWTKPSGFLVKTSKGALTLGCCFVVLGFLLLRFLVWFFLTGSVVVYWLSEGFIERNDTSKSPQILYYIKKTPQHTFSILSLQVMFVLGPEWEPQAVVLQFK